MSRSDSHSKHQAVSPVFIVDGAGERMTVRCATDAGRYGNHVLLFPQSQRRALWPAEAGRAIGPSPRDVMATGGLPGLARLSSRYLSLRRRDLCAARKSSDQSRSSSGSCTQH